MPDSFPGLDLGQKDYSPEDEDDILGLNKFTSKPSPRKFQPFGGSLQQQAPTFQEPQQIEQPQQTNEYYNVFDDAQLGQFEQLDKMASLSSKYKSSADKVYKLREKNLEDFVANDLKPFYDEYGAGFDYKDNYDQYISELQDLEKQYFKQSKKEDGFFSSESDARASANQMLSKFKKFSGRNGLLDRFNRFKSELDRYGKIRDAAAAEQAKYEEVLLSIPMQERLALEEGLKGPKTRKSKKQVNEALDSMQFEKPMYNYYDGLLNVDKVDPRYKPKVDFEDGRTATRQAERMDMAYRGKFEGLLSRRDQVLKDRQMRDRGVFFSSNGTVDGRPFQLSREDVDILDLNDIRKTGIKNYKGKPIDEAIASLGGEERLKVAELLQAVFTAYSNREDRQIAYFNNGKTDADKEAMEKANEAFEGILLHAADKGLTDEIVKSNESQGFLSSITSFFGNAIKRGWHTSELAEYADDFFLNNMDETAFEQFIAAAENLEQVPTSKSLQNFMGSDSDGVMESLGNLLFENPAAIPEMFVESLASFLPTYVKTAPATLGASFAAGLPFGGVPGGMTGLGVGARLNWGIASAAIEYSSTILEEMKGLGIDYKNPRVFMAAWNNEATRNAVVEKAEKRGLAIGTLDAIAGMMGSRVANVLHHTGNAAKGGKLLDSKAWNRSKLTTPRFTKFQRGRNAALEIGTDSTLGTSGELIAQLLTREEGEKLDYNSLIAEGIIGVGPGLLGAVNEVRGSADVSNVPFDLSEEQETATGTTGKISAAGFNNQYNTFKDAQSATAFIIEQADVTGDQQNALVDIFSRLYDANSKEMSNLKIVVAERTPFKDTENPASFHNIEGQRVIFLNKNAVGTNPVGAFLHESGHLARLLMGIEDSNLLGMYDALGQQGKQDAAAQYITKNHGQKYSKLDETTQKQVDKHLANTRPTELADEWFAYQFARVLTGNTAEKSVQTPLQQFLKSTLRPLLEGYVGTQKGAGSVENRLKLDRQILNFMGYSPQGFKNITFGQYITERPGMKYNFFNGENRISLLGDEEGLNYLMREIRAIARKDGKSRAKKVARAINGMVGKNVLPTDDKLFTETETEEMFRPMAEAQVTADAAVDTAETLQGIADKTGSKDVQAAADKLVEPKMTPQRKDLEDRISSTENAIAEESRRRKLRQGEKDGLNEELKKAKDPAKIEQLKRKIQASKESESKLQKRKAEFEAERDALPKEVQAKGQTDIDVAVAQQATRINALNKFANKQTAASAKAVVDKINKNRALLADQDAFEKKSAQVQETLVNRLKEKYEKIAKEEDREIRKEDLIPTHGQIIAEMLDLKSLIKGSALTSQKAADDLADIVSSKNPDPDRVVQAFEEFTNEVEDTISLLEGRETEILKRIDQLSQTADSALGAKKVYSHTHRLVNIVNQNTKTGKIQFREWDEKKNDWGKVISLDKKSADILEYKGNEKTLQYKQKDYKKASEALKKAGKKTNFLKYRKISNTKAADQATKKASGKTTKTKSADKTKKAKKPEISKEAKAEISELRKILTVVRDLKNSIAPEKAAIHWKDIPHAVYYYRDENKKLQPVTLGMLADQSSLSQDDTKPKFDNFYTSRGKLLKNVKRDPVAYLWQFSNWRIAKPKTEKDTKDNKDTTEIHWTQNKNKVLSNFSIVKGGLDYKGVTYNTVEGAYQANKSGIYVAGFENLSGSDAQKKARADKISTDLTTNRALMKELISIRYKSDSDFKQALDKAKANITHPVQDKFWKVEFPKILNEVREVKPEVPKLTDSDTSREDGAEISMMPIESMSVDIGNGQSIEIDQNGNGGIYTTEDKVKTLVSEATDDQIKQYFGKEKSLLITDMRAGKAPNSPDVTARTIIDPDIGQAYNPYENNGKIDYDKKLDWAGGITQREYLGILDAVRASAALANNQKGSGIKVTKNKDGDQVAQPEKIYFQPDKGTTHVSLALWRQRLMDQKNGDFRDLTSGTLEELNLAETVVYEVAEGRTLELLDDRDFSGYKLQQVMSLAERRAELLAADIERLEKEKSVRAKNSKGVEEEYSFDEAIQLRKRKLAGLLFDPHTLGDKQGEESGGLFPKVHSGKPWTSALVEFLFYKEKEAAKEAILRNWSDDLRARDGIAKPSDKNDPYGDQSRVPIMGYLKHLDSPEVLQELQRIEAQVFGLNQERRLIAVSEENQKSYLDKVARGETEAVPGYDEKDKAKQARKEAIGDLIFKLLEKDRELMEEAREAFAEEYSKKAQKSKTRFLEKLDITNRNGTPFSIEDYTFFQAGEQADDLVGSRVRTKGEQARKRFRRGNVDLGIPVLANFIKARKDNDTPLVLEKTTLGFNELADPIRAYGYEKSLRKNVNTNPQPPNNIESFSMPKAKGKGAVSIYRENGVWKYKSTKRKLNQNSINRANEAYVSKVLQDIENYDTKLAEGAKSDNHVSLANFVNYILGKYYENKGDLVTAMEKLDHTASTDAKGINRQGAPGLGLLPSVWFTFIKEAYTLIGYDSSKISPKADSKYSWNFDAKTMSFNGEVLEGNMFKDGVPDPKDMAEMVKPIIQAVVDAGRVQFEVGIGLDEDKTSKNLVAGGELQQFDSQLSDAAEDIVDAVYSQAGADTGQAESSGLITQEGLDQDVDTSQDTRININKSFKSKDFQLEPLNKDPKVVEEFQDNFEDYQKRISDLRKGGKGTTLAKVLKEFKNDPGFWRIFGLPVPPQPQFTKKLKASPNYPRFKEIVLDPDDPQGPKPPKPGTPKQPQPSIQSILDNRGPVTFSLGARVVNDDDASIFARIMNRVSWFATDVADYLGGKRENFKLTGKGIMDSFVDQSRASTKVLRDALIDAGVTDKKVLEALDVRALWHQYFGKTDEAVRQAEIEYIEPIMDAMREHDVTNEEWGSYITARAVPTRNIHLEKLYKGMLDELDPTDSADAKTRKELEAFMKKYKGKMSGIETAVAVDVVKKMEAQEKFKNFLNDKRNPLQKYYDMNMQSLVMRGEMGLIQNDPSKGGIDEVAAMRKASSYWNWRSNGSQYMYKIDGKENQYSYSPMQGFEGETETIFDNDRAFQMVGKSTNSSGRGWDQPRQKLLFKGSFGRPDGVPGPDPNTAFATAQSQFFEGAIRAHKNEVSQAFGLTYEVLRAMAYHGDKKAVDTPLFDLSQAEFKQVEDLVKNNPEAIKRARELFEGKNRIFEKEYNPIDTVKGYKIVPKAYGGDDPGFKMFRKEISRDFQNNPMVFVYRKNGIPTYIQFANTEAGGRAATSIKNLRYEALPSFLQGINKITRFMASMFTSRNPAFLVPNFVRDLQTAWIHLNEDEKKAFAKDALSPKQIYPLMRAIYKVERKMFKGESTLIKDAPKSGEAAETFVKELIANGDWERVYQYAKQAGAKVGYFRLDTIPEIIDRLAENKGKRSSFGPKAQWDSMVNMLDSANSMLENSIRISAFAAAVKNGSSIQEAAKISRNVTVDFNQKGNMTQTMGSLFVFFGASMNSLHRMFKTMHKRGFKESAKMAGYIAGASVVMAMFNRAFSDDEDEIEPDYDRISTYKRDTNFIITDPREGKTGYYSFPLPLGYNVFWAIGQYAADFWARYGGDEPRGGSDPLTGTLRVLESFMNTANPMGGASLSTFYAPSALEPVAQLAANKNFMGLPIRREDPDWGVQKPAHKSDGKHVRQHWTDFSELINKIAGGDDNIKGSIRGVFGDDPADNLNDFKWDFSGSELEHLFTGWTGGPGQLLDAFFGGVAYPLMNSDLKEDLSDPTGETWANKIPILNRFYRSSTSDGSLKNKFYKVRQLVKESEIAVKNESARGAKFGAAAKKRFKTQLQLSGLVKMADTVKQKATQARKKVSSSKLDVSGKLQRVAKIDQQEHNAYVAVVKKAQSLGIY